MITRTCSHGTFILRIAFACLLAALFAGCRASSTVGASAITPGAYVLQHSIRLDRGLYRSTNYRGASDWTFLPINQEVRVVGPSRRGLEVQTNNGTTFEFVHIPKHSKNTFAESFAATFGPAAFDLSGFSEAERAAILAGRVEPGMSRRAVLASLGRPPAHQTPDLDANAWRYWKLTFVSSVVQFDEQGRVVSVQGPPL